MSSTVWTFGPGGIYTATWDGVSTVTVTLTSGGAFLASFAPAATLSVAQAVVAAGFAPQPSGLPQAGLDTVSSLSGVVPSYSTIPRWPLIGSAGVLTSQAILAASVLVPGGTVLSNLGYFTGGTAAVTPVNQWLVLMNQARQVLGVTADQGAAAIGTFAKFQYPMTAPVAVPGSPASLQFLYIGLMVNAATVPSLECGGVAALPQSAPAIQGNSSTGQTGPPAVGATMAALTVAAASNMPYFWAN